MMNANAKFYQLERGFVILLTVSNQVCFTIIIIIIIMIGESGLKQAEKVQENEAFMEALLKYIMKKN